MKLLILSLCLYSFNALASGCSPYDVELVSESVVVSIGKFEANDNCYEDQCYLSLYKKENGEYHNLYNLTSTEKFKVKANVDVKIYVQYFVSSCAELHRYVVGVDLEGKRFREVKDLDSL